MTAPIPSHARIESEAELLTFLNQAGIPYQRVEHPAVYTCEQADRYRPPLPAASTKNLFLRDRHAHFYLLMTACEKPVDLKGLSRSIGVSKLHFGSEEQLLEKLGVTPGAVTLLGLINDDAHEIQLLVDSELWVEEHFLCHPLVNTATLLLSRVDLLHFFDLTGHAVQVVEVPTRVVDV
jgi:Ala-tRNA(Pro) deacylase